MSCAPTSKHTTLISGGSSTPDKSRQESLTPDQIVLRLKEGNDRFVKGAPLNKEVASRIEITKKGQFPLATILGCIDSRVPPEIIFDQSIGDLFVARIAGEALNDQILGSLEYASQVGGSKVIVVLGHSQCGAVKGAIDGVKLGHLTPLLAAITPSVLEAPACQNNRTSANASCVQEATEKNVAHVASEIISDSPILKELVKAGRLKVLGAYYDVATGIATFQE